LKVVYSARYLIDIGLHVFPTRKYELVHARLIEEGVVQLSDIIEPTPATWDELGLVHTDDYLSRMLDGAMSPEDIAQLELPWSQAMVDGFRLMTGGTIQAALIACGVKQSSADSANSAFNVVGHIGGGLHHAFPNHGEGFCPFNDVAVAVRVLQKEGIDRVAIVDLDVHHGNGTAFIFNPGGAPPTRSHGGARAYPEQDVGDPRVFTFSMHQQHNYPMWKPRGSLDIGLADGARDDAFLSELERALPRVMAHEPGCVFYLAGADPYEDDQLGGLRLTKEGLRQRDRLVIEAVRHAGIPLVITLAGGYARRLEDTVAIHAATIEEAARSDRT
jgi:acetoin utilization deacetylase AcuC-like enzyme